MLVSVFHVLGPLKEPSDGQYLGDLTLHHAVSQGSDLDSQSALMRASRSSFFSVSLYIIGWGVGSTNVCFP